MTIQELMDKVNNTRGYDSRNKVFVLIKCKEEKLFHDSELCECGCGLCEVKNISQYYEDCNDLIIEIE